MGQMRMGGPKNMNSNQNNNNNSATDENCAQEALMTFAEWSTMPLYRYKGMNLSKKAVKFLRDPQKGHLTRLVENMCKLSNKAMWSPGTEEEDFEVLNKDL